MKMILTKEDIKVMIDDCTKELRRLECVGSFMSRAYIKQLNKQNRLFDMLANYDNVIC